MRIGIDIDDTIADTNKTMSKYGLQFDMLYAQGHGIVYKDKLYHNQFDWSSEVVKNFYEWFFKNPEILIPLKPFVLEVLIKLKEEGHTLVFITARGRNQGLSDTYLFTQKWLDEMSVPYDILYTDIQHKGPICMKEELDLFIDDSYNQCSYIAMNYPIKVFWMTKDKKSPISNMTEVSDFLDVYQKIVEL